MKHNILSLAFWQDTAIYGGKSFPSGTLGCDALNIPPNVIERLNYLCIALNAFMGTLNTGCGDPALLPAARKSSKQIVELLKNVKPFSYPDVTDVDKRLDRVFSEESLANANAYYDAVRNGTLTNLADPRYKQGLRLLRVLPILAHLGYSLGAYQNAMLPFAEKLNVPDCKRTPEGYAELFGEIFPVMEDFGEGDGWMSMTNATLQYVPVVRPGSTVPSLVKRMLYVTFVGMFRSDLYEGLCVGHAPKKCPVCGRWFLTTNAKRTKYCGSYTPEDRLHRTCRQIGNLKGREQRELAEDHPLKQIYTRRLDSINHRLQRRSMEPALAKVMKKLAKDKLYQAISNVGYAQGEYENEMELSALEAEALALL